MWQKRCLPKTFSTSEVSFVSDGLLPCLENQHINKDRTKVEMVKTLQEAVRISRPAHLGQLYDEIVPQHLQKTGCGRQTSAPIQFFFRKDQCR